MLCRAAAPMERSDRRGLAARAATRRTTGSSTTRRRRGSAPAPTAAAVGGASGRIVVRVDYVMTDEQVQRIREEPVHVGYRGLALVVQASAKVSRLEQFERYDRHAELDVVHGGDVVAYIARDSEEQRLFFTARMFDIGLLGFGARTLMDGIAAVLGEHE